MVWHCIIQRGVPRFIFFGYINLPPAMAQVNAEARKVYKDDCKYYKLADTQRVTIYAPQQDMFLFKQYTPGLRLATPGEWSPVPVEMTPSPLPLGLISGMNTPSDLQFSFKMREEGNLVTNTVI
jgi:hypothetical protein